MIFFLTKRTIMHLFLSFILIIYISNNKLLANPNTPLKENLSKLSEKLSELSSQLTLLKKKLQDLSQKVLTGDDEGKNSDKNCSNSDKKQEKTLANWRKKIEEQDLLNERDENEEEKKLLKKLTDYSLSLITFLEICPKNIKNVVYTTRLRGAEGQILSFFSKLYEESGPLEKRIANSYLELNKNHHLKFILHFDQMLSSILDEDDKELLKKAHQETFLQYGNKNLDERTRISIILSTIINDAKKNVCCWLEQEILEPLLKIKNKIYEKENLTLHHFYNFYHATNFFNLFFKKDTTIKNQESISFFKLTYFENSTDDQIVNIEKALYHWAEKHIEYRLEFCPFLLSAEEQKKEIASIFADIILMYTWFKEPTLFLDNNPSDIVLYKTEDQLLREGLEKHFDTIALLFGNKINPESSFLDTSRAGFSKLLNTSINKLKSSIDEAKNKQPDLQTGDQKIKFFKEMITKDSAPLADSLMKNHLINQFLSGFSSFSDEEVISILNLYLIHEIKSSSSNITCKHEAFHKYEKKNTQIAEFINYCDNKQGLKSFKESNFENNEIYYFFLDKINEIKKAFSLALGNSPESSIEEIIKKKFLYNHQTTKEEDKKIKNFIDDFKKQFIKKIITSFGQKTLEPRYYLFGTKQHLNSLENNILSIFTYMQKKNHHNIDSHLITPLFIPLLFYDLYKKRTTNLLGHDCYKLPELLKSIMQEYKKNIEISLNTIKNILNQKLKKKKTDTYIEEILANLTNIQTSYSEFSRQKTLNNYQNFSKSIYNKNIISIQQNLAETIKNQQNKTKQVKKTIADELTELFNKLYNFYVKQLYLLSDKIPNESQKAILNNLNLNNKLERQHKIFDTWKNNETEVNEGIRSYFNFFGEN